MNKSVIKSIVKKDFRSILSSKRTWMPMIIISTLLCIIMPIAFSYFGTNTNSFESGQGESIKKMINMMFSHIPDGKMKTELLQLHTAGKQFTFFFLNFMLISIFLMVTVINSMVTSTSSFVGEKERGTLETLLFSPISIKELFIAKVLASFVPSISITYIAYLLSFTIVNAINYHIYHMIFMFNTMWIILMFWVIPSLVLLIILFNVLISAKVKTYQEAQQFGGLLVLPVVGLVVSQSSGLFLISPVLLLVVGGILFILDILLLSFISKFNQRNSLFEKQIH